MKISNFDLTRETFIIAEIGANHEGNIRVAKELIKRAAETGVNAVKFQTYQAEKIVAPSEKDRLEHFRRLSLKEKDFLELASLAHREGLNFLSTPFHIEAVDLLDPLVPAFKIASGDLTFHALLEYVAGKNKPILLSTGMSTVEEIRRSIEVIERANPSIIKEDKLLLLHCISAYPASPEDANLRSVPFLKETFKLPVGYSDHTLGIETCLYAVAAGACLIEKHFTIDKAYSSFRDHQLSANPGDMKELVKRIRHLEKTLGEYQKEPVKSEIGNRKTMRRSLVAAMDIIQGTIITKNMLSALRPETGIPADRLAEIAGEKRAGRNIAKGDILRWEDLKDL